MANYRLFIDESCHLENDGFDAMTIGYIKVEENHYQAIKERFNEIISLHHIKHEIKWNTCSRSKLKLYLDLIDLFFTSELSFRAILVKYKQHLDHDQFNHGSHDNFYYKMIYHLLNNQWLNPAKGNSYKVFLDLKDTRGREKLRKINEIFTNHHHGDSPFVSFQHIRSHESVYIQLADLFLGAISYKTRKLIESPTASEAKLTLIKAIEDRSGYSIDEGTEPWESKFNIFEHQPKKSR